MRIRILTTKINADPCGSGSVLSLVTCTEPQVAEDGVGISQLHQILLHGLALLRPCT
jgi:hypothetical protein